ncbi:MAG: hypothetical protein WD066_12750 [Planctomycetaceae bacterium]
MNVKAAMILAAAILVATILHIGFAADPGVRPADVESPPPSCPSCEEEPTRITLGSYYSYKYLLEDKSGLGTTFKDPVRVSLTPYYIVVEHLDDDGKERSTTVFPRERIVRFDVSLPTSAGLPERPPKVKVRRDLLDDRNSDPEVPQPDGH